MYIYTDRKRRGRERCKAFCGYGIGIFHFTSGAATAT
jgi:hypothetical protein